MYHLYLYCMLRVRKLTVRFHRYHGIVSVVGVEETMVEATVPRANQHVLCNNMHGSRGKSQVQLFDLPRAVLTGRTRPKVEVPRRAGGPNCALVGMSFVPWVTTGALFWLATGLGGMAGCPSESGGSSGTGESRGDKRANRNRAWGAWEGVRRQDRRTRTNRTTRT